MKRCRVSGTIKAVSGTATKRRLIFRPEHAGVMPGEGYVAQDDVILTTEADGTFVVALVPSAVVGTYKVIIGEASHKIKVPTAQQAKLEDLLQEA